MCLLVYMYTTTCVPWMKLKEIIDKLHVSFTVSTHSPLLPFNLI